MLVLNCERNLYFQISLESLLNNILDFYMETHLQNNVHWPILCSRPCFPNLTSNPVEETFTLLFCIVDWQPMTCRSYIINILVIRAARLGFTYITLSFSQNVNLSMFKIQFFPSLSAFQGVSILKYLLTSPESKF